MKYDALKEHAIINGINITHNGEVICEKTYTGDFTASRKGRKGDAVTDARYDVMTQYRLTVLPTSPLLEQFRTWAEARNPLTFQYSNGNTGEVFTSNTAYLQTVGGANGEADREFTINCEFEN